MLRKARCAYNLLDRSCFDWCCPRSSRSTAERITPSCRCRNAADGSLDGPPAAMSQNTVNATARVGVVAETRELHRAPSASLEGFGAVSGGSGSAREWHRSGLAIRVLCNHDLDKAGQRVPASATCSWLQ